MRALVLPAALLLAHVACSEPESTPVGVTLQDGQILVGQITTEILWLDSALGPLAIPLDDVGVVLPVAGERIAESGGLVTVWLRNGSELRGQWTEPELAVGVEMGGEVVNVELPVGEVQAVQTRGSELWPTREVYRIRTTTEDDFLVDPEHSRLAIENELGVFSPFLSECAEAYPLDDPAGDWRVELRSGTVLVGPLRDASLSFVLPMGPERLAVPIERLVSIQREHWQAAPSAIWDTGESGGRPGLSSSEGWFDYRELGSAKK